MSFYDQHQSFAMMLINSEGCMLLCAVPEPVFPIAVTNAFGVAQLDMVIAAGEAKMDGVAPPLPSEPDNACR